MKRLFCDRCGVEQAPGGPVYMSGFEMHGVGGVPVQWFDLCEPCIGHVRLAFDVFVSTITNKEESS